MDSKNLNTAINGIESEAFKYLKSLPRHGHSKERTTVIDDDTAQSFVNTFRTTTDNFTIPISWCMTKDALVSMLGITSFEGFEEINGIRFYASINDNNQLTLVAVSTIANQNNVNQNDDLTADDNYPYYDYADPCPNNCSSVGSLSVNSNTQLTIYFARVNQ